MSFKLPYGLAILSYLRRRDRQHQHDLCLLNIPKLEKAGDLARERDAS